MTPTHFHLFVYGTLKPGERNAHLLSDGEWVGPATVGGVLYDIDGQHPTLLLYGSTPVSGMVCRCPVALLEKLDQFEQIDDGLFRRVAVTAQMEDGTEQACWTYVAGPKLAHKLTPGRRIRVWRSAQ